MIHRWIVTALGKDRPGIVAGVTQVLYRLGCNLEDSAMNRLEGEFTIMLIFSCRATLTELKLRQAFQSVARRLALIIHLKRLTAREAHSPRAKGERHLISVYGADRPGIVFRVSQALAKIGVNITDVHAHRSAGNGPSLYLLLLEVEIPLTRSVASIERQLKRVATRLRVRVSLRAADAAIL
jgi:glycine cleavage system transcriptional repressor